MLTAAAPPDGAPHNLGSLGHPSGDGRMPAYAAELTPSRHAGAAPRAAATNASTAGAML